MKPSAEYKLLVSTIDSLKRSKVVWRSNISYSLTQSGSLTKRRISSNLQILLKNIHKYLYYFPELWSSYLSSEFQNCTKKCNNVVLLSWTLSFPICLGPKRVLYLQPRKQFHKLRLNTFTYNLIAGQEKRSPTPSYSHLTLHIFYSTGLFIFHYSLCCYVWTYLLFSGLFHCCRAKAALIPAFDWFPFVAR